MEEEGSWGLKASEHFLPVNVLEGKGQRFSSRYFGEHLSELSSTDLSLVVAYRKRRNQSQEIGP